jgi:hypothetical protein
VEYLEAVGVGHALSGLGRWAAAAASLCIGVGAVGGGFEVLRDAEGFGLDPAWIAGSPFNDYRIPGLFLFVVIGGGMMVTAGLALWRSDLSRVAALTMGMVLALWLAIETAIVGWQGGPQAMLLLVCGGSVAVLILAALVGRRAPETGR